MRQEAGRNRRELVECAICNSAGILPSGCAFRSLFAASLYATPSPIKRWFAPLAAPFFFGYF